MEASVLRAPAGLSRLPVPSALLRLRSDEQLVALFRAGDEHAFRVIHDRYRVRLLAYARQMLGGSGTDAEDALQDVFLRAYHALRADERPIALRAWLYRVAHNRCIDHLRRPTPRDEDVFDLSRTPPADPSAETERRDDLRRLVADVRRLPEQQRSALLMRELEGLAYADLATALDVTIPAVKSLLVRARMGLAEAQEARDTACAQIREDLADAFERGVRASALARRHVRECDGCERYRAELRGVRAGLHSLAPAGGPLTLLAQLLGLGGAGTAAGGAAAAGGGGAAVVGGISATATTAKVAAVVASAAIAAQGAAEVRHVVKAERERAAATAGPPGAGRAGPDAPVLRAIGATVASPAVVAPVMRPAPAAAPEPHGAARERRDGNATGVASEQPSTGAPAERPAAREHDVPAPGAATGDPKAAPLATAPPGTGGVPAPTEPAAPPGAPGPVGAGTATATPPATGTGTGTPPGGTGTGTAAGTATPSASSASTAGPAGAGATPGAAPAATPSATTGPPPGGGGG